MAQNNATTQFQSQRVVEPDAALQQLEKLVGAWVVSGDAQGQVTYEWMEGGFFLIQRVDLEHNGNRHKGIEIIGRERGFGASQPSADIKSRYYDIQGDTLDYVYELEGDVLTIWGGEKGSPAYYRGTFSADSETLTGGWHWPGGGYGSLGISVVPARYRGSTGGSWGRITDRTYR